MHIDKEVREVVNLAYNRAKKLLTENRDKLEKLAKTLIEKEVLDIDEARKLLDMVNETISSSDNPLPSVSAQFKEVDLAANTSKNNTTLQ